MYDDRPAIYLEGNDHPVDYTDFEYNLTYDPVWSDGTFDGTFVPKQIGAIANPPDGKITLLNGDVIAFSALEKMSDGSLTIKQPYHVIAWTRKIEP